MSRWRAPEVCVFERVRGCVVRCGPQCKPRLRGLNYVAERGQVSRRGSRIYRFSGAPPRTWSRDVPPPGMPWDAGQLQDALSNILAGCRGRLRLSYSLVARNRLYQDDFGNSSMQSFVTWCLIADIVAGTGDHPLSLAWSGRGNGEDVLVGRLTADVGDLVAAAGTARSMAVSQGPAVLSPLAAGLLMHEAVGHTVEAPGRSDGARLSPVGCRLASELLSVDDDPLALGGAAQYEFDDENVRRLGPTSVVREGVVVSQLHSMESGFACGFLSTASARAATAWDEPMPRMSNLLCRAGESPEEALIAAMGRGLYIHRLGEGMNDGRTIQATVVLAEAVENGSRTGLYMSGGTLHEALDVLIRVDGVGNNPRYADNALCGKHGQVLFDVGTRAPSLRLRSLRITA